MGKILRWAGLLAVSWIGFRIGTLFYSPLEMVLFTVVAFLLALAWHFWREKVKENAAAMAAPDKKMSVKLETKETPWQIVWRSWRAAVSNCILYLLFLVAIIIVGAIVHNLVVPLW